ncbi:MAG TPA: 3-dehydroquinate synthase [Pyrinomonadaceae bacterium]|nr:3-dehydroquinate synthase [Pyrinomonadaceae bacterium]
MAEGGRVRRVAVRVGAGYTIEVGAGALDRLGVAARSALGPRATRAAVISNPRVFGLYGRPAAASLRASGFAVAHWLMGDGERFKTLRTAERALRFLSASRVGRGDAVVALGGGVVGDLAGFAAALHLRGVAFVQAPTTLLAQVDSSVGGKTGVNTPDGKNLVGAFHQPRAVVADTATLRTLPPRELTAGWCEAVKQGAAGDRRLYETTVKFLERERSGGWRGEGAREEELARLVAAQCAFKAGVVAGDEREEVERTDARSRRVLNFGHTVGHALEAITDYRRFRHGEAVGWGMLAAAEISVRLGLLGAAELESLRGAVRLAGRLPRAADLGAETIRRALGHDKKSVGGRLRWVLLEGLGRARVVDGRDVPWRVVRESLRAALGVK